VLEELGRAIGRGLVLIGPDGRVLGPSSTEPAATSSRSRRRSWRARCAWGASSFRASTLDFQPLFPMVNVGARVLSEFRVTFDQKSRRMRLVRG
jgi:hypothetical protein